MSFRNDNIIIKNADKKIIHQSSCYRIFVIFLIGHCSITSGLLDRSKRFGFSIVLMTYSMRVYGYWNAKTEGNVLLHKKQYTYSSLDIARHIVKNKIENQIAQLHKIRNKDESTKENITKLEEIQGRIFTIESDLRGLLGMEGIASKLYFQEIFSCCAWKKRSPRTKIDSINTLLDIGYTMLFNMIDALLNLYGFDTYQGVYHKVFYQRKSLVCDLVEPFRPIVDYTIRNAYKRKQINPDDFIVRNNRYFLTGKESNKYVKLLLEALLEYKDSMFLYVQSYYRAFIRGKSIDAFPYIRL